MSSRDAEPHPARSALRLVAALEALKGIVVLLTASGLMALVHQDLHRIAVALVRHAHLNPAAHYPTIFVDTLSHLGQHKLWLLATGAAAYASLRLAEAYGLWFERAWGEWLAAASGALYVPFELAELLRHHSPLGAALLLINLLVVGLMLHAQQQRRRTLH